MTTVVAYKEDLQKRLLLAMNALVPQLNESSTGYRLPETGQWLSTLEVEIPTNNGLTNTPMYLLENADVIIHLEEACILLADEETLAVLPTGWYLLHETLWCPLDESRGEGITLRLVDELFLGHLIAIVNAFESTVA